MAISLNLTKTSRDFFPTLRGLDEVKNAALHVAELVEQDSDDVNIADITELKDYFGIYHAWVLAWQDHHNFRAIVEVNDETRTARLIAVVPVNRFGPNYELTSLMNLWKAHRTRRRNR